MGWPPIVLYCARRTRPFSGRAFREHGGHRRSPPLFLRACSSSLQGWRLIDLQLRAAFSPTRPLANIFHPPYLLIASQSISRDVPVAQARASQFSLALFKRSGRRCRHPRSCWKNIGKNLQHSGSNSGKASKVIAIWLLVTS